MEADRALERSVQYETPVQQYAAVYAIFFVCEIPVLTCLSALRFMSGPQQLHIVDERTQ